MAAPVVIATYDPRWAEEFAAIREMLLHILRDLPARVEHVGSTSVPGLCAKPIIDLDVLLRSADDFPRAKALLEAAGYRHEGDLGIAGREAFCRDEPDGYMPYHLYVCAEDAREAKRHLAFRDYLRTHDAARDEYGALKRALAERFREDRDAYTLSKTEFVEKILAKAL